jgi:hypothetical protein
MKEHRIKNNITEKQNMKGVLESINVPQKSFLKHLQLSTQEKKRKKKNETEKEKLNMDRMTEKLVPTSTLYHKYQN